MPISWGNTKVDPYFPKMRKTRGTIVPNSKRKFMEYKAFLETGLRTEASEINLVRSGLDDTMRTAYQEIREVWRSRKDVPDLRTAAYILAVQKIAHYYTDYAL